MLIHYIIEPLFIFFHKKTRNFQISGFVILFRYTFSYYQLKSFALNIAKPGSRLRHKTFSVKLIFRLVVFIIVYIKSLFSLFVYLLFLQYKSIKSFLLYLIYFNLFFISTPNKVSDQYSKYKHIFVFYQITNIRISFVLPNYF